MGSVIEKGVKELSEEARKSIAKSEEDIKKGRIHEWEDIKKELGLDV